MFKRKKKSQDKLENTLRLMTMKTQHTKIYGMQQKQCSEGNLQLYMPTLKKKSLKSVFKVFLTLHFKELEKEMQTKFKAVRRKEIIE